jgi:hypothetical protein
MATLSKGQTFAGAETVTATKLNNLVDNATIANIVNADISASAAIAGTKVAPNFGAQNVVTTGTLGAGATTLDGTLTLGDNDIVAGDAAGTKIGTATTQKLGFFDATPIVQPAGADQAAVATTGATDVTPFGYTEAQANEIVTLVNEMRSVLVNLGLMKGAA